ncbi:hypothetical protein [uncultured Sphingorhabdus sp.]|uniref:hypothetical protein n=1 Tax=uncultured Sphingorhabdus sp. TaxID=1686106 RepID=UPI00262B8575|nr:hypothetical protein [uncultured Sphingorhabdus sp.]HMS19080.1 hypothetical protein [Sphingorhabdus sp.]
MRLSTALFVSAGLALLIAVAPVLITFAAAIIAQLAGCQLNEGMAHRCVIAGKDYGQTLYEMGVAFWLFLLTALYLPVAVALGVAALINMVRGREDPAKNGKTGWVFWLLMASALLLPILGTMTLILVALAGIIVWNRKRTADSNS